MVKVVWPPIVANEFGVFDKCCEKKCADMDPEDPCKCDCECPDIAVTGTPICILEKDYQMWTHPSGCITNWYEYTSSATYETYDEAECGWPSLEYKFTDEQKSEIEAAIAEVDRLKAVVADLEIQVQQKPDSFGLPLALANAKDELATAESHLTSISDVELKFWHHGDQIGNQGCSGYGGQYYDPNTGEEGVFVKLYDPFAEPEPHWPSAWLPEEGIEIYPGSGLHYYGTRTPRPSGSECGCESSDPCPEREPRYTIDLNEDGEITSDETDLCANDDGEYYECEPQEDCAGCMNSESSNYDPNATTDDGSCCDEGCTQSTGDPCVYEAPDGKDACCCEENFALPAFWFGEEPADAGTVCYLEDLGEVCLPPDEEEGGE
jgi:hypothetical protein